MRSRFKFTLFNAFIKTGVEKKYDKELSQSIILINYFSLQTAIVLVAGIISSILYNVSFPIWTSLFFILVCVFSVWLNKIKMHILAGYFLILSINIAQFYFCLLFGLPSGIYLFYFPLIIGSGLVFASKNFVKHQYALSLTTAAFAIIFFLYGSQWSMPDLYSKEKNEIFFKHNFIVSMLLSLVSGFFVSRMNQLRITLQDKIIEQKQINEKNSVVALKENKVLLAEIHHRVKNNLAIMGSLIRLQISTINDEKLESYLNELLNRIDSMSYVHEKLYRNNNFSFIQAKDFLRQIATNIINSFDYRSEIQFNFDCENCVLNLNDAIPLALITNEAITNSMKYAFEKSSAHKIISFTLSQNPDKSIFLKIRDNGQGFDMSETPIEGNNLGSFLIRSLSEQLDGVVKFYNDGGAVVDCHLFIKSTYSNSDIKSQALDKTSMLA